MNLKPYITNAGMAILNRLMITGQALSISSARLGSGKLSFSDESDRAIAAAERTELIDERVEAQVVRCQLKDGVYSVVVQVESVNIEEELYVWEIGLYAKEDGDQEALLCYISFSDAPDWIPPATVAQYVRNYEIGIAIQIENAVMKVSPAALVKMEEFLGHAEDKSNPHDVTPAQIGAAMDSHTHIASQISDIVPVSKGGTGASDAAAARENLGVTPAQIGAATAAQGAKADAALPSASYTAPDVLAKLKTADGAGSGLDADMLDGVHGSEYYSGHADTGMVATVNSPQAGLPLDVTVRAVASQSGSGYPSPDNVRPITGRDSIKVAWRRKNLWDSSKFSFPRTVVGVAFSLDADGFITLNGTVASNYVLISGALPVPLPNGTYRLSAFNPVALPTNLVNVQVRTPENTAIGEIYMNGVNASSIYNTTIGIGYIAIGLTAGAEFNNFKFRPQFELGSITTDYVPFSGEDYQVVPSSPLYGLGGAEDEIRSDGMVVRQTILRVLNGAMSEPWFMDANQSGSGTVNNFYCRLDGGILLGPSGLGDMLCDRFRVVKKISGDLVENECIYRTSSDGTYATILISTNAASNATDFRTWLADNPLQILYGLATPTTEKLASIPPCITSLSGVNYIYTDAGGETTAAVRAGDMQSRVYDADGDGVIDRAARLETARAIALTGGATASGSFDGSANLSLSVTSLDVSVATSGKLPTARLNSNEVMLKSELWMESGIGDISFTDIAVQGTYESATVISFRTAPPNNGQRLAVLLTTRTQDVGRLKLCATAIPNNTDTGFTVVLANLGNTTVQAGVYYFHYLAMRA